MKKKVTTLTIVGLIFLLIAFGGYIGLGYVAIDGTVVYDAMASLANTGTLLTQQFTNMTVMTFVSLGVMGLFLILLIVQICMAIKKKHGPAAAISITTLIGMALIFFFITYYFLPGYANDQFGIITLTIGLLQAGKWLALIYFIPALFFVIGFILMLVALICDLKLLAELPNPRLDREPADDIMVIHDEDLESEESAATAKEALARGGYEERHSAEMFPPAPGIQGPLLIQYINTYAPAETAGKKNTVPVTEIQDAINGEKPLNADDIRKIIKEELGAGKEQPVIVNVPATPKEPEGPKALTAEEVRSIISEEIGRYLTAEEPEEEEAADIYVEPEPEPSLSAEDIRSIIASELAKAKEAEAEPEPEPEPEPIDVREAIRAELEAHRRELEEENRRKEAEEAERARREEEKNPN